MRDVLDEPQAGTNRRSFIKKGIVTAAGATVGAAGLLTDIPPAIAKDGGLTSWRRKRIRPASTETFQTKSRPNRKALAESLPVSPPRRS
jgi:hypothetical protein